MRLAFTGLCVLCPGGVGIPAKAGMTVGDAGCLSVAVFLSREVPLTPALSFQGEGESKASSHAALVVELGGPRGYTSRV